MAALDAYLRNADGEDFECEKTMIDKFVDAQLAKLSPAAMATFDKLASEYYVPFWAFVVPLMNSKYNSFYPGKQ